MHIGNEQYVIKSKEYYVECQEATSRWMKENNVDKFSPSKGSPNLTPVNRKKLNRNENYEVDRSFSPEERYLGHMNNGKDMDRECSFLNKEGNNEDFHNKTLGFSHFEEKTNIFSQIYDAKDKNSNDLSNIRHENKLSVSNFSYEIANNNKEIATADHEDKSDITETEYNDQTVIKKNYKNMNPEMSKTQILEKADTNDYITKSDILLSKTEMSPDRNVTRNNRNDEKEDDGRSLTPVARNSIDILSKSPRISKEHMNIIYDVLNDKFQSGRKEKTPNKARKGQYFSNKLIQKNSPLQNPLANQFIKLSQKQNFQSENPTGAFSLPKSENTGGVFSLPKKESDFETNSIFNSVVNNNNFSTQLTSNRKKENTYNTEAVVYKPDVTPDKESSESCDHFKPDGNNFFSISIFGELISHELTNDTNNINQGKMIAGVVDCSAVDHEYEHIYIAYNKGYLVKYCLHSFNVELDFGKIHERKITFIEVSKQSKCYLLTGSQDGVVRQFDRRDGNLIKEIEEDNVKEAQAAKLTHDDQLCIIAYNLENDDGENAGKESFTQLIMKYNFENEMKPMNHFGVKVVEESRRTREESIAYFMGLDEDHEDLISCMAITYDNLTQFTAGNGGELMEWDIPSTSLQKKYYAGTTFDAINNMIIAPDNKHLFTIGDDCYIQAIDLGDGKIANRKFAEFKNRCTAIAISSDSKYLFIATGDKLVYKYSLELKEILSTYKTGHNHTIFNVILPVV